MTFGRQRLRGDAASAGFVVAARCPCGSSLGPRFLEVQVSNKRLDIFLVSMMFLDGCAAKSPLPT